MSASPPPGAGDAEQRGQEAADFLRSFIEDTSEGEGGPAALPLLPPETLVRRGSGSTPSASMHSALAAMAAAQRNGSSGAGESRRGAAAPPPRAAVLRHSCHVPRAPALPGQPTPAL